MEVFFYNMKEILFSLAEFMELKAIAAVLLGFGAYLIGSSHVDLIVGLTVLVSIDAITGTYAAWITKEVIESRKALRSAIKWTAYLLMIITANISEMLIPGDFFMVEVTVSFLAATEFISILENIGKSGYAIPLKLLNKLQDII